MRRVTARKFLPVLVVHMDWERVCQVCGVVKEKYVGWCDYACKCEKNVYVINEISAGPTIFRYRSNLLSTSCITNVFQKFCSIHDAKIYGITRPHWVIGMRCSAKCFQSSTRTYSTGFHSNNTEPFQCPMRVLRLQLSVCWETRLRKLRPPIFYHSALPSADTICVIG